MDARAKPGRPLGRCRKRAPCLELRFVATDADGCCVEAPLPETSESLAHLANDIRAEARELSLAVVASISTEGLVQGLARATSALRCRADPHELRGLLIPRSFPPQVQLELGRSNHCDSNGNLGFFGREAVMELTPGPGHQAGDWAL